MADIPCTLEDREYQSFINCPAGSGKVAKRVCDEVSHGLLADIITALGGGTGTPFFAQAESLTVKNVLTSIVSVTVPVSTARKLTRVSISCSQQISYKISIGATVVGSGRTGPGNPNDSFVFNPNRTASAGDTVKIEYLQQFGPAGMSIEAYLMALDESV